MDKRMNQIQSFISSILNPNLSIITPPITSSVGPVRQVPLVKRKAAHQNTFLVSSMITSFIYFRIIPRRKILEITLKTFWAAMSLTLLDMLLRQTGNGSLAHTKIDVQTIALFVAAQPISELIFPHLLTARGTCRPLRFFLTPLLPSINYLPIVRLKKGSKMPFSFVLSPS